MEGFFCARNFSVRIMLYKKEYFCVDKFLTTMSKSKLNKLLVFLSFFWITNSFGQYDIDSLKTIVANPKLHDTTRLAAISLLVNNTMDDNELRKSIDLLGRISQKNFSKPFKSDELRIKYTSYLASYYHSLSARYELDIKQQLKYIDKSIQLYTSIKMHDEASYALISKGVLFDRQNEYMRAIDCYYKALKYFEFQKDKSYEGISYAYSRLGYTYGKIKNNSISIKYLKKAIFYIDKMDLENSVQLNEQKGLLYINIGSAYLEMKNYNKASENFKRGIKLSKNIEGTFNTSLGLAKLAVIDIHFNRLDEAEKKLLLAKSLSPRDVTSSYALLNLGKVYFKKKNYDKAQKNLEEGLKLSKILKNIDLQQQLYELLYKVNKAKGDYKESITMLELFNEMKDSAKNDGVKNELKQQQLKYDYEKKELNYKLESQRKAAAKNNLLIGLSSVVVLLLIGAYFFYRNYKQKQAIASFEKNELNQKLLLSQMNPHFIFNSIDNIQSLIYNKQDKEAVNYLTKFSKLTRQILENSSESYIALSEELIMIDNYLVIQQLLYNNKFDFNIDVDDSINTEGILLPPMLAQPFIENAIKHGFKNAAEKGFISISFKFSNEKLFFEITDNGAGFSKDEVVNKKSLAMKITKERLANISNSQDFDVRTENRFDDKKNIIGAKVFFEIPYIYEN
jgi:tetratricopeptide (TPR) repeat protein